MQVNEGLRAAVPARDRASGIRGNRTGMSSRVLAVLHSDQLQAQLRQELTWAQDMRLLGSTHGLRELADSPHVSVADALLTQVCCNDSFAIAAQVVQATRQRRPDLPILALLDKPDGASARELARLGVRGIWLLETRCHEWVRALRELLQGLGPLHPALARQWMENLSPLAERVEPTRLPSPANDRVPRLSIQELQTLRLCAEGLSYDCVARQLNVSRNTILTYARRGFRKLGACNARQAVSEARRRGYPVP